MSPAVDAYDAAAGRRHLGRPRSRGVGSGRGTRPDHAAGGPQGQGELPRRAVRRTTRTPARPRPPSCSNPSATPSRRADPTHRATKGRQRSTWPSTSSRSTRARPRAERSCSTPTAPSTPRRTRSSRRSFPRRATSSTIPEAIWDSQLAVAKKVIADAGASPDDIAAIGITNQRETTVVWDKNTGKPVQNAIVWQSRITAGYCDELKAAGHEAKFRDKTGLPVDAYFSGTKIRHILQNNPGAQERAEAGELLFGTVDSFLIWRLTEGQRARRRLLERQPHAAVQHPHARLGRRAARHHERAARDDAASRGRRARCTARRRLLGGSLKIAGDAGDQQAATFGQACFEPGMAKQTYGTGAFMLINTGETGGAVQERPADHGRLGLRRQGHLRARGIGLHRRRRPCSGSATGSR